MPLKKLPCWWVNNGVEWGFIRIQRDIYVYIYIYICVIYIYIYVILMDLTINLEGFYGVLATKCCSKPWIAQPSMQLSCGNQHVCWLNANIPSPLTLKSHVCPIWLWDTTGSTGRPRIPTMPYAHNWKSRLQRIWKPWAASLRRQTFHGFIGVKMGIGQNLWIYHMWLRVLSIKPAMT